MKKSLARNSIYNLIYRGVTVFFPIITATYISRVLLAEGVGKISYASTIVSYFVFVAALGLPQYGVKVVAQNISKEDRSKAFSELFFINFCSTTICTIAFYLFINLCGYFENKRFLLNVMGIQLILNIFNIDWYYQGTEEYGYITTRSLIVKVFLFLSMFIFVKKDTDYVNYAFILCVATAGNYVLNVWNLRGRVHFSLNNVNIRQHLRPVFVLLALSLATEIYTMLDTVMIEYFHGDVFVGYYSNSVKIVRLVHTLSIALVTPFYPRISLYMKQNETIKVNQLMSLGFKMIMIVSIPCVVGIELLSDRIVAVLFGNSFGGSVVSLRILAPLIVIFSVAYFQGHLVLLSIGQEIKILMATVVGAIINSAINLLLIPTYKHYGASISSVIAESVITMFLVTFSKKYYRISIGWRNVAKVLVSVVLMIIIVYISLFWDFGLTIGLFASIFSGFLSYILFLVLFKNDMTVMIISNIRNIIVANDYFGADLKKQKHL